jgi:hypothetical protein
VSQVSKSIVVRKEAAGFDLKMASVPSFRGDISKVAHSWDDRAARVN